MMGLDCSRKLEQREMLMGSENMEVEPLRFLVSCGKGGRNVFRLNYPNRKDRRRQLHTHSAISTVPAFPIKRLFPSLSSLSAHSQIFKTYCQLTHLDPLWTVKCHPGSDVGQEIGELEMNFTCWASNQSQPFESHQHIGHCSGQWFRQDSHGRNQCEIMRSSHQ